MATAEVRGFRLEELAQAIRSVDPRAALVPSRVLRRVIRGVLGLGGFARGVPHRDVMAVESRRALEFATRDELGLDGDEEPPAYLILLAEPDLDTLDARHRDDILIAYWRRLFHARVHLAYEEGPAALSDLDGGLNTRIERLGRIEFAEARQVLVEDGHLVLPVSDRATFVEFAALYLELAWFRPSMVAATFPAIRDHADVRTLLATDVGPGALLEATRPAGAPLSPIRATPTDDDEGDDEPEPAEPIATHQSPEPARWDRLKAKAAEASEKGNNVRAAILKVQAAQVAPAIEAPRTRASARSELETLVRRLRAALGFDADEAARWRRSLPAFLDRASRGLWPREARLLYDIQKVCIDHERPIHAVDLGGWLVTFGRRPLKRVLPDHREVVMLRHLRAASKRLARLRGPEPARGKLTELVARAIHHKQGEIRDRFRDRIAATLDGVGLRPANVPERASRRKLVEELLDLIVERGFLRIGDLRDAISRNQMKLRDVANARELIRGDALLRADAELAKALDGVYHRGEIYLRGLQRASALAFGTRVGRAFSTYVALPFGGTFIILEGLQHIIGPIVRAFGGVAPELLNELSFVSLGLLLLGIINISRFRLAFLHACSLLGRGFRLIFRDLPRWMLRWPMVRAVVSSRGFAIAWNWIAKPALIVGALSWAFPTLAAPGPVGWMEQGSELFLVALIVNSRPGRDIEEIAADGASRVGLRIWHDYLPNLFRGTMESFAAGLEMVERLIYTVDEHLRFRTGEGRLSLVGKAVLGLIWFFIAYVARIYINLLIEPQINPIKHFPVVTVSHKIMLPMIPQILRPLRALMSPLGPRLAETLVWPTVFLLPGVFGFIVWELKGNWKLYAANRPRTLRPVSIGHHGESLCRYLRRGFHSGTIPRLFGRLRRADRLAEAGKGHGKAEKVHASLEHVDETIRHFVDRAVIFLLDESRSIGRIKPRPGTIDSATNRIVIDLRDGDSQRGPIRIVFEESSGRLRARIDQPGWLDALDDEPRRALTSALGGLYAMSDVDLATPHASDAVVDLREIPITWNAWVDAWENDAEGRGHPSIFPATTPPLLGPNR